jgi:glycosyltransferase involved in cell wall biosynthesis
MDVTVITPTIVGREGLLLECIESVKGQIEPVADHRWLLDVERRGPAYTRNRIAMDINTEWIAFLDDDDLLLPEHFNLHKEFVDTADVIFSWGEVVHGDGGRALFDSSYNEERILAGHNSIPVTATVRRSLFNRVGGFDLNERFEDWALWKALILVGARFQCIQTVTWHYRIVTEGRNAKE